MSEQEPRQLTDDATASGEAPTVWIMVDHSDREPAYEAVAGGLRARGANARVVTVTEVIGTFARSALEVNAERLLRGVRVAIGGRSDEDLIGAVRRVRPDMLAVTSPRFVRGLSVLEGLTGIASLQVGVTPDYNLDDRWLKSSLHGFVVPHQAQADRITRGGVDAHRVLVAGPAVRPGFARTIDREAERRAFGFAADQKVVLVRAEAFDLYTIEKVIFQARLVDGVTFVFHHNSDGALANTLRRVSAEHGLKAIMFGRVDDLERYVAAADAVLVAPGDAMIPDIIAQARPVLIVGDAAGMQEQVDFLVGQDMGEHVSDVLRLGAACEQFMRADALDRRAKAAGSIGLPGGSEEVAAALFEALERADQWRATPQDRPPQDHPQDEEAPRGPFESIGDRPPRRDDGSDRRDDGGDHDKFAGISRAEAKEQLAQLILQERELERRIGELEKEQQRWRNRLDLAREWGERDLEDEAQGILREYVQDADKVARELNGIKRQKLKLRQAAQGGAGGAGTSGSGGGSGGGASADAERERRFRKMETERELDGLRDRLRREMGED